MPSLPQSRWRSYRDVDGTSDPTMISDQLDDIASVGVIAGAKQWSLGLLGLSRDAKVLDVGCGNGPELAELARIVGAAGRVVGLDRSSALIADAEARGLLKRHPIELVVGDAQALPFKKGEFDASRADRTLQHLDQPEVALGEMARVTRPGGRIVATESRWGLVAPDLDEEVTHTLLQGIETPDEHRHWLGLLLPIMFQMVGLVDVRVVNQGGTLTDYDELVRFGNFNWSMDEAVRAGALSREQVGDWSDSLRGLVAAGKACVQVAILHVVGTKPR